MATGARVALASGQAADTAGARRSAVRVELSDAAACGLAQDLVGGCKNVFGDDTQAAVAVIDQPVSGAAAELRYPVCEQHNKWLLRLQRQDLIGPAHIMPRFARGGGWYRPVLAWEFRLRYAPTLAAIARQDRIAGMRMHDAFRSADDAVNGREAHLHLAFQFARLHVPRVVAHFSREAV